MSNGNTVDGVVANDGEDLRFPISSSSGFSSPFSFSFRSLFRPARRQGIGKGLADPFVRKVFF
jgi:hypothetical protein